MAKKLSSPRKKTSVTFAPEVENMLQQMCKKELRSPSVFIEILIRKEAELRGVKPLPTESE